MSSLPNEIFSNITNFLPNDDITDFMLLSSTFNGLVTRRLRKINQEMSTKNQSIKSFMPSPKPEPTDTAWISQLNHKKFEPVGSAAKKRMKDMFEHQMEFLNLRNATLNIGMLDGLKKKMSLERFDDRTFLRILSALVAIPKFRQEYNISFQFACTMFRLNTLALGYHDQLNIETLEDLRQIWKFYNTFCLFNSNALY